MTIFNETVLKLIALVFFAVSLAAAAEDQESVTIDKDVSEESVRSFCERTSSAVCDALTVGFFTTAFCNNSKDLAYVYPTQPNGSGEWDEETLILFLSAPEFSTVTVPIGYEFAYAFRSDLGVAVNEESRLTDLNLDSLNSMLNAPKEAGVTLLSHSMSRKREAVEFFMAQAITQAGLPTDNLGHALNLTAEKDTYQGMGARIATKGSNGIAIGMRAVAEEGFRFISIEDSLPGEEQYPLSAYTAVMMKSENIEEAMREHEAIWSKELKGLEIDKAYIEAHKR